MSRSPLQATGAAEAQPTPAELLLLYARGGFVMKRDAIRLGRKRTDRDRERWGVMQESLTRFVASGLIGAALFGALTGWLSSLQPRPFRWLANHPWRTFWIVFGLLAVVASVTERLRAGSLDIVTTSGWPVLVAPAIQGLRVSYLRGWWRALLILFVAFVLTATLDSPGFPPELQWVPKLTVVASWAFAAVISHQIGRRLPGGVVVIPKRSSTLRYFVTRLRSWPNDPIDEALADRANDVPDEATEHFEQSRDDEKGGAK